MNVPLVLSKSVTTRFPPLFWMRACRADTVQISMALIRKVKSWLKKSTDSLNFEPTPVATGITMSALSGRRPTVTSLWINGSKGSCLTGLCSSKTQLSWTGNRDTHRSYFKCIWHFNLETYMTWVPVTCNSHQAQRCLLQIKRNKTTWSLIATQKFNLCAEQKISSIIDSSKKKKNRTR